MKWAILAAIAIGVFGFIPGMGIPGGIAIALGTSLLSPVYHCKILAPDVVWPAAILATWIIPIFIPLGFWISYRKLEKKNSWIKLLVFTLTLVAGSVLVTIGIELKYLDELKNTESRIQSESTPPLRNLESLNQIQNDELI